MIRFALKAVPIWLAATMLSGAAGCADSSIEMTVARDGSATLQIKSMSSAEGREKLRDALPLLKIFGMQTGMAEMMLQQAESNQPLPRKDFEEMARAFGPGVKLTALTRTRDGASRGFRAEYRIPDVSKLQMLAEKDGSGVKFDFVRGKNPILKILPARGAQSRPTLGWPKADSIQALDGVVAPWLRELRARAVVKVAGRIQQTNGRQEGASTVVLATVQGRKMRAADMIALMSLHGIQDVEALHRNPPAGIFVENPARPLIIRFE